MTGPDRALRLVLADDHHFFREGLRGALTAAGMSVVGEATDGEGALELARTLKPDVAVIDLHMPGSSGIEAIRRIAALKPEVRVMVLTVSTDEGDVIQALAQGAVGYVFKDTRIDELAAAVELVGAGHAVMSRAAAGALARRARTADPPPPAAARRQALGLSARELEVIRLIAEGADNATIGRALSISPHTVKQHVTNILAKLGVRSRVQAAVFAVRAGLV